MDRPIARRRRNCRRRCPPRYAAAFTKENLLGETVAWAVPCVTKKLRGVPANSSGLLIATIEDPSKLLFVARKSWGLRTQTIHLEGCTVSREPKFLSENLVIAPDGRGAATDFHFRARGRGARAADRRFPGVPKFRPATPEIVSAI